MIEIKKIKKGNQMNKIILIISILILTSSTSYAKKVECDMLSPMQKAIYKAYCAAEAKKVESGTTKKSVKQLGKKSGKIFEKVFGGLNTDSKLFKTGKFKKDK